MTSNQTIKQLDLAIRICRIAKFDESQHPRDEKGRFSQGEGAAIGRNEAPYDPRRRGFEPTSDGGYERWGQLYNKRLEYRTVTVGDTNKSAGYIRSDGQIHGLKPGTAAELGKLRKEMQLTEGRVNRYEATLKAIDRPRVGRGGITDAQSDKRWALSHTAMQAWNRHDEAARAAFKADYQGYGRSDAVRRYLDSSLGVTPRQAREEGAIARGSAAWH